MGGGDLSKIAHQHGLEKVLEVIEGQKFHESKDNPLSGFFPIVSELDPNAKPKPTIRVPGEGWTLSEFARDLGGILREQNFFNLRGKCVRIEFDPEIRAYRLIETNPQEFRSLVERFCWPVVIRTLEKDGCQKEHFQVKRSLPHDISKATLASPQFLEVLRPIAALNTVRLPALRREGTIELLPEGYDSESRVFTVSPGVQYDEELRPEDAKKFLNSILSEFCFKADDRGRAVSVAIAQMLTLYCSHLLNPHTLRPVFLITSNAEGAGKTLLAKLAVIPRLGYCPTGSAPAEEAEWRKLIFSTAVSRSPVLFIDNTKGHLKSSALEALATSPFLRDRVLGQSQNEDILHGITVIITGNGVTISGDLRRRTLLIELFLEEARAEDRIIQKPLDDATVLSLRSKILSALWALVRGWTQAKKPKATSTHPSFFAWSELVGSILENAGLPSPCSMPVLDTSGDRDQIDMEKLVDSMRPGHRFTFGELVNYAKDYGLFEHMIPDNDQDKEAAAKRASLSLLWKHFAGRVFARKNRFSISGQSQKTRRYYVENLEANK